MLTVRASLGQLRAQSHLIFSAGAAIDVERGREDLGKAQDFKKKALKKKILCLGLVVVAVIIILLGKRTLRTSLDIKGLLSVRSNLELPSNAKPVKLLNFIK